MAEQIRENIYRIGIPLQGNPLKEINSYLIHGEMRDLLIDTGFRREECIQAMEEGIQECKSTPERLDIFLTHLHSDHSGMAVEIAGVHSKIFMHRQDYGLLEKVLNGKNRLQMTERFVSEGMPADMVERIQDTNPARLAALEALDERFCQIEDGQKLYYGGYEIQALHMPGHSPGQMMLWIKEEQIMFTGDHVLFDITPNITAYAEMEDALGTYLHSLKKAMRYPVREAFPGHRNSGNYRKRIQSILAHHDRRLRQAEQIIREHSGLSAYEIAGYMAWRIHVPGKRTLASWEEFPETQRWYAMGECLSHLDYLRGRSRVKRVRREGLYRYFPV